MINKSLLALGAVIHALTTVGRAHVPYRDSVLTWLLKDSLGGNAHCTMIANVSPDVSDADETRGTLRYAERTKKVVTHARVNEDPRSRLVNVLRAEVKELKRQLVEAASNEGSSAAELERIIEAMRGPEQQRIELERSAQERMREADALARENAKLLSENAALHAQLDSRGRELHAREKQMYELFNAESALQRELAVAQRELQYCLQNGDAGALDHAIMRADALKEQLGLRKPPAIIEAATRLTSGATHLFARAISNVSGRALEEPRRPATPASAGARSRRDTAMHEPTPPSPPLLFASPTEGLKEAGLEGASKTASRTEAGSDRSDGEEATDDDDDDDHEEEEEDDEDANEEEDDKDEDAYKPIDIGDVLSYGQRGRPEIESKLAAEHARMTNASVLATPATPSPLRPPSIQPVPTAPPIVLPPSPEIAERSHRAVTSTPPTTPPKSRQKPRAFSLAENAKVAAAASVSPTPRISSRKTTRRAQLPSSRRAAPPKEYMSIVGSRSRADVQTGGTCDGGDDDDDDDPDHGPFVARSKLKVRRSAALDSDEAGEVPAGMEVMVLERVELADGTMRACVARVGDGNEAGMLLGWVSTIGRKDGAELLMRFGADAASARATGAATPPAAVRVAHSASTSGGGTTRCAVGPIVKPASSPIVKPASSPIVKPASSPIVKPASIGGRAAAAFGSAL